MRYVLVIGMALGVFGNLFCLAILPLAARETGWLTNYEYTQGTGLVALVELAVICLGVKAAALLKASDLIRVKLRGLRAR
jgi:hypothetical protein